jgi:hypothetical protein
MPHSFGNAPTLRKSTRATGFSVRRSMARMEVCVSAGSRSDHDELLRDHRSTISIRSTSREVTRPFSTA